MQARDLRARDLLLATISHELRTPMEAVVAMGELLLATPLDETQQRHAETLLQSSRSLLNALNDVLDFSRLETGRFVDLHALIHDVAADLQARKRQGSHRQRRHRHKLPTPCHY
jgi:signal transduction histidine kinase